MTALIIPFVLLWTLSTATAKHHKRSNPNRATPIGIAAYRSALTLDWLSAADHSRRQLMEAMESEPMPMSQLSNIDCVDYARPTATGVARLMLELLKNLEGDDGYLVSELVQALVRSRLLGLESSVLDSEPDFEALIKTPNYMVGQPHTTVPRIVETLWMAVTDPSTVEEYGWCTVQRMTQFLQVSRPSVIATHMHAVEDIASRARYIIEEFIQQVTPLNILRPATSFDYLVKEHGKKLQPDMRRSVQTQTSPIDMDAMGDKAGTDKAETTFTLKELEEQAEGVTVPDTLLLENNPYSQIKLRTPRKMPIDDYDIIDLSDVPKKLSCRFDFSSLFIFTVIIVLIV